MKSNLLFNQVDRCLQSAMCLDKLKDMVHLIFRQFYQQQTIFSGVDSENIGKGRQALSVRIFPGRNDHPVAVLDKGPDRVFPTGAAAEIIPGNQYGTAFKMGVVKFKLRIRFALEPLCPSRY